MPRLPIHPYLWHELQSAWREAEPKVIQILAHTIIYMCAVSCLALALAVTWILSGFCSFLFGEYEHYVSLACCILEVIISIYLKVKF